MERWVLLRWVAIVALALGALAAPRPVGNNFISISLASVVHPSLDFAKYLPWAFVKVRGRGDFDTIYLLIGDTLRRVHHPSILHAFDQRIATLPYLNLTVQAPPSPQMKAISVDKVKLTPFLDMENRKSKLVQGSLIYHISFIGTYANPAILSWRGRLLLVTGNNWGRNSGMQRLLTFKWLGESGVVSDGQVSERHMHDLCISHLKHSNLSTALRGEDVRVVVQGSDRLQVFFTNSLLVHNVRMSMAQLFLNSTSGCVEVESYETIIEPLVRSSEQQKNWTPFIHLGSTYLIQFINPLTVVQPIKQMDGDRVRTVGNVVSQVGNATLHWPYGLIHGGTNALLMASGRYLSFFHSVIRRPEAHYNYTYRSHKVLVRPNLYFIGAFTFSSTLPFKLLQISRMPIMSPKLWVGPKVKKQNIETVVFPTHFFFNGSDCVISAGYQDIEGLLLRIDTSKLLNSLVDVEPY